MICQIIHFYLIQETWLDGNDLLDIKGFKIFHHGLVTQVCSRGQKGVAIILSPEMYLAYKDAGERKPFCPEDPLSNEYGRFISLKLAIRADNNKIGAFCTRRQRNWTRKIVVILSSVYHPVEPEEQELFNNFLAGMYNTLLYENEESIFISGQDMNSCIGTNSRGYKDVLGPYGPTHRNAKGSAALSILRSHHLWATTSFFEHHKYNTWRSPDSKTLRKIDEIIVNKLEYVTDSKVVGFGTNSDHDAQQIHLKIKISPNAPHKNKSKIN